MRTYLLAICFLLLMSCDSVVNTVTIENNSQQVIDSARIRVAGAIITFHTIEIGKSEKKEYTIKERSTQEGSFAGRIYLHNGDSIVAAFGYYSNTSYIEDNIAVEITRFNQLREH